MDTTSYSRVVSSASSDAWRVSISSDEETSTKTSLGCSPIYLATQAVSVCGNYDVDYLTGTQELKS
jgi:hypothetical protein